LHILCEDTKFCGISLGAGDDYLGEKP
jgi:hypothetical protein